MMPVKHKEEWGTWWVGYKKIIHCSVNKGYEINNDDLSFYLDLDYKIKENK